MKNRAILIGGFHEMIELCESCHMDIVGIIDNDIGQKFMGYEILGGDEIAKDLFQSYGNIPIIVSPDHPSIRKKLVTYYSAIGFDCATVVSPAAWVSKSAQIGRGVVVQSGVNVSSFAVIGNFVKLNTNANVMHDCRVGDFSTIAPNAVLLGKVSIGECCYIGANATILPGKNIGVGATIGAAAVVTKDVATNVIVVGNPAKELSS